jgi:hypothetical protein
VALFDVEHLDAAAERDNHIEQGRPRRIHADRIEDKVGVREQQCGAQEECGGGDVSGDRGFDRLQLLTAGNGQLLTVAGERCAEGPQGVLGVVAGADGFGVAKSMACNGRP